MKHYTSLCLKILLTGVAFYIVWKEVNWQEFSGALSSQNMHWVAGAIAFIVLQIVCGGLRWHQLLSALTGGSLSALRIVRLYFASLIFNVFMPGTLGSDVSRIWLTRRQQIPAGTILYSILVDRIFSLLGLLVVIIALLPFFFERLGLDKTTGELIAFAAAIAIVAGFWLLLALLPRLQKFPRLQWISKIHDPLVLLKQHPSRVVLALTAAAGAHMMSCATYYALAMSLALPVSYFDCLVLIPVVMFASAVPISIGGWGVRELGTTTSLALIGIAAAPAALIGLQVGLLTTLISACGGIVYLLDKRKA